MKKDDVQVIEDTVGRKSSSPGSHLVVNSDLLREQDSIELTATGKYVWLVTLAAAIGGLLFGYDTGVISGVLVIINDNLGHVLSDSDKELITSITSAGAFLGALWAGSIADRYGRKIIMILACITFSVGAIIQAASFSLAQMTVGRFIIGLGVGAAAMIVPLYIAELAPARLRGRMVVIDCLCITGGQVIAYVVDAIFYHVPHGWRYMVGLGAVPSLLLLAFMPFLPETPRQLIAHGKHEQAAAVLAKIYPKATAAQVSAKINVIQADFTECMAAVEGKSFMARLKELYKPANFRALVVACGLMAVQQLCGFNSLMYYSATLFALVGFDNPVAVGLVVAGTNFLFTCVALKYIDVVGRRRILIWSMWGMSAGLVMAAVAFHFLHIASDGSLQATNNGTSTPGIIVLVAIIIFVAFYASGLGNVPWQANELFPMEVRSLGTMMVTCTCWGGNIIISATFLTLMKAITPSGAFGLYAGICFFGWIAVILCYPEVAGMNLEEIRVVFEHGFGVRYAEKLRKERKEALKQRSVTPRAGSSLSGPSLNVAAEEKV